MNAWIRVGGVLVAVLAAAGCSSSGDGVGGSKFASALSRFISPSGSLGRFDNQSGGAVVGNGFGASYQSNQVSSGSTGWSNMFGGLKSALVVESKADGTQDCSAFASCVTGDPCLSENSSWSVDLGCFCGVAQGVGYACEGSGTMSQTVSFAQSGSCYNGSIEYGFQDASLMMATAGFTAEGSYYFAMEACAGTEDALLAGEVSSGCLVQMYDITFSGTHTRTGLKWCASDEVSGPTEKIEVLSQLPDDPSQEFVLGVGQTYSRDASGNVQITAGKVSVRAADGALECDITQVDVSAEKAVGECRNLDTGQTIPIDGAAR